MNLLKKALSETLPTLVSWPSSSRKPENKNLLQPYTYIQENLKYVVFPKITRIFLRKNGKACWKL
jgi:hypothetical protein